ncbi:arginase [Xylariaceae sp. FL1272]|nr:arginase [Xylariaceae sp. FL1272]
MLINILFILAILASLDSADVGIPQQHTLGQGEDPTAPVGGKQALGLHTFAKLPFQNCLAPDNKADDSFDIAIVGAPFDLACGVTGRPGERAGPAGIRRGSQRLGGHNIFTGKKVSDSGAKVVDCGDADLTALDKGIALDQLLHTHRIVSSHRTYSEGSRLVPRIITLGGDHTTTLPALRSTKQHWGPVSVLHFDSHLDTWSPDSIGLGVNHGTWLHIAHSEGLIGNNSIHVGIHAPAMNLKHDLEHDHQCGFQIITSRDFDTNGTEKIIQYIRDRIGENLVYISIDIDVLDPAFAPGTGTPEPGGLSSRELLTILDGLIGMNVIGADVVEVAPAYDSNGEITVLVAAQVALSLLSLVVAS